MGAPEVLVCSPHPTQTERKVKKFCTQIGTTLRVLEAQTQWANRAELYVGLMMEATRKDMQATGLPLVLWDYCMEQRALIFQITAKKLFQLNGTNPHTMTLGWMQTSQTYANLVGTNGFISEKIKQVFFSRKSGLADASAQLEMRALKWPSGF